MRFATKANGKQLLGWFLRGIFPEPGLPIAALTYHSIGQGARGSLSEEAFRAQLRWLHDNSGCCSVSNHAFAVGKHDGRTKVLVTFDDGYLDNWELARPILDEFNTKAFFFVTTGFVDGDRSITKDFQNYRSLSPMTWDQVGKLAEQGHVVGLHGDRHRNFRALSPTEAADEMHRSAEKLLNRVGVRAATFAYPFGLPQHQRNDLTRVFVDLGIQFVFTSLHRRGNIDVIFRDPEYRYRLPRLRVDPTDSIAIFSAKIRGYWDYVASVQRVSAALRR